MSNEIFASPTKNYLTRNGFVMISNLLLDYQNELGLTEGELTFIIRVLKNRMSSVVHDRELDPTVSSRTLARRRTSLKEKGYLKYSIVKKQDELGVFRTEGIMYDLSQLEDKLQAISDKMESRKVEKLKKELKEEEKIVITDTPIEDFKSDFKDYYGVDYNISEYEAKYYNNLSEENKKILSHIFEYCRENNLLGQIVPRLSFFFKVKFRFVQLRQYCIDNGYLLQEETYYKTDTEKRIKEQEDKVSVLVEQMKIRYNADKNYALSKAIERICYRFGENEELTIKMIDKFIEDNL